MWRIINVLNLFWAFWPPRHFSQFSHSVVSDSLWPYGLQHIRLPCPSPILGAYSNSCPSSRGCHPTISSSVIPFSSCPQSLPASGSFPVRQLFTSGGQNTAASRLEGISPSSEYSGLISFRINWFDLLAVQGTLKSLLQHHNKKESVEECTTIANKLFKEFLWMWITVTCFEAGRGTDKIFIANNHIFGKNNPWI